MLWKLRSSSYSMLKDNDINPIILFYVYHVPYNGTLPYSSPFHKEPGSNLKIKWDEDVYTKQQEARHNSFSILGLSIMLNPYQLITTWDANCDNLTQDCNTPRIHM